MKPQDKAKKIRTKMTNTTSTAGTPSIYVRLVKNSGEFGETIANAGFGDDVMKLTVRMII